MVERTNDDIYEAVLDTRGKVNDLAEKVEGLREHVNDEREKMMILINANIARVAAVEAEKLDRDSLPIELLKSIGFKLMNRGLIRWAVGAAAAWAVGTVVWFQGPGIAQSVIRAILHLIEHG